MADSKLEISSDFAILDVKAGRAALNKHFRDKPISGPCPPEFRVPVVIRGFVSGVWGGDDGVSREFQVDVDSVEVKP